MEWIGTRVAEDVVQLLRMTHTQQSGIMNGHMSVCNRVLELYTAVQDLRAAAVREGVEAARHRKQQKEALAEVQTQIDQMKQQKEELCSQMTEIKLRIKSLQRQEKKEMLADEKWELMKNQLRDVMIQMKEIHEELREIRGHKTEQTTTVTTTTRVTGSSSSDRSEESLGVDPLLLAKEGRWEAYYADQTRRTMEPHDAQYHPQVGNEVRLLRFKHQPSDQVGEEVDQRDRTNAPVRTSRGCVTSEVRDGLRHQ